MLSVVDIVHNIFRYTIIEPMVLVPNNLSDYGSLQNMIDQSQFVSLDKVYLFKQASDMICVEVVKDTKIEIRLKKALSKVADLLKDKKWTSIYKKVTIESWKKRQWP